LLKTGILNPQIASLLARVRHTNTLVIADRGFPYWPKGCLQNGGSAIETIDISLTDDIPTVLQVLRAIVPNFTIGKAWMASEFTGCNSAQVQAAYLSLLPPVSFEPHTEFKLRVPQAIGLIRTGDTTQYGNVILESA
jgi:D-ribose pyranase